jgi:hypothetical protein
MSVHERPYLVQQGGEPTAQMYVFFSLIEDLDEFCEFG